MNKLRIGTRGSALARWQADWVAARLAAAGTPVELVPIATRGDHSQQQSIGEIGTGVFTKELQRALLEHQIDLAVHSLKDLPTEKVKGLSLSAVPGRESPHDVLISRGGLPLAQLPAAAAIGTGSLRRRAQILHARPDLAMKDIRGNVDTRLRKLDDGQYDALVLAEAGLKRLGMADRITQVLDFEGMLPAVGQGALGIETRSDDAATIARLAALDDADSHRAVLAERSLLDALSGGCLAPIGALARIEGNALSLRAVVLSADGKQRITAADSGAASDAEALGRRVAELLIAQGARQLIESARRGAI